jgi:serine/threonine-protein kinase HipA
MTHALHIWAEETHIATLEHETRDDRWRLKYAAHWAADAKAYAYTTKL